MISKDEILKRGSVEVHAKVGGIRQRHTLKVVWEKTAWGTVPFCVSSFQLPASELLRLAQEIGLPIKCRGMVVFPKGKAAQDFVVKDDPKKPAKPVKKKALAHDRVLGFGSGVTEEAGKTEEEKKEGKKREKGKEKEEKEASGESEEEAEEEEAEQEEEKEEEEKQPEGGESGKSEGTEKEERAHEEDTGEKGAAIPPQSHSGKATQEIEIESSSNSSEKSEPPDKPEEKEEKKKFFSEVLSEGLLA